MSDTTKRLVLGGAALLVPALLLMSWLGAAGRRLQESEGAASDVAVASMTDDTYCTPQLKGIVRRVASACGLLDAGGGRGCQPMQAAKVAALSGGDFNALFQPLSKRAKIIQFDVDSESLDAAGAAAVEAAWSEQRGASFFFVVARASADGDAAYNVELSRKRAQSVLTHLEEKFKDPELKKEVGLLWLGAQYAQLSGDFCSWSRSRDGECSGTDINRSAFVAWIDCAI